MNAKCRETGQQFEVTPEDSRFYERVSPVINGRRFQIPPPTLCPEARMRRRLAFRNERTLYRRRCDKTGRELISTYAPEAPFPVYDHNDWFQDGWDALEYGRD